MSIAFALPAVVGAAQAATTAGQASGAADATDGSGDPLGLFGQILALLGVQPAAAPGDSLADCLALKTLAQGLKVATDPQAAAGDDAAADDKSDKAAAAAEGDVAALLAALLAAAQQAPLAPAATASAASAPTDEDQAAVQPAFSGGKSGPSLSAQLEVLLAALTAKTTAQTGPAAPTEVNADPTTDATQPTKVELPADPDTPNAAAVATDEAGRKAADPVAPAAQAAQAVLASLIEPQISGRVAPPRLANRAVSAAKPVGPEPAPAAAPADDRSAVFDALVGAAPTRPVVAQAAFQLRALDPSLNSDDPADTAEAEPQPDRPASSLGSAPAPAGASVDAAAQAAILAPVRGSPDTVAKLAAKIVKQLEAKITRFQVGLDPVGLGRVDVKVEIGANGRLHAQLSFDNAAAAADLRGRAGHLREALEQAGFDLKGGSISFDAAGQGDQGRRQQGEQPRSHGQAGVFEAALNLGDTPMTAPAWTPTGAASGVDIRI